MIVKNELLINFKEEDIPMYGQYIGVAKTLYNSSATIINSGDHDESVNQTTALTERILRSKSAGNWPKDAIMMLRDENYLELDKLQVSENRDVITPKEYEKILNDTFPFLSTCSRNRLDPFLSGDSTKFIGHHMAHAYCALRFSPFKKSIILVIDGAGSEYSSLSTDEFAGINNIGLDMEQRQHEEHSIYLQDGPELKCVQKKWQTFYKLPGLGKRITNGVGICYETVAEYIFGSNMAAGKVMGLASFGNALPVNSTEQLLQELDWDKAFKGKGKQDWESSPLLSHYQDIAATMQNIYEQHVADILQKISADYPDYDNVIIVGGSALNCTNNTKIIDSEVFKRIYIPPAPDDKGISTGLAYKLFIDANPEKWSPFSYELQTSSFGLLASVPTTDMIQNVFSDDQYVIFQSDEIEQLVATKLSENKIIAWFHDRSEIGPRALGNRSILASPMFPDLKQYLNDKIKFRESFRPYGSSCLYEKRHDYFDYPKDHESPFMSFTIPVKQEYLTTLQHVTHVDNTSRVQTVRAPQNQKFYSVIENFGKITGIYCLLNTSLNIMGEPIVENIMDLKNFFDNTPVDAIAINEFYITKKE